MSGYAVVDVETTGFSPNYHHRIVEVAVVHVAQDGKITAQWSTLLNPQRDLGPRHVHRIRAADVRRAPTFDRAAGVLTRLLAGRVPVAHNLAFDARFLLAEYARMGIDAPLDPAHGLCTMQLAGTYLPSAGKRSLEGCCAAVGIRQQEKHDALADARAAAGLLGHYLSSASPPPWRGLLRHCATIRWPDVPEADFQPVTRTDSGDKEEHFLARIVERIPSDTKHSDLDPYLAVLDRALLDRHLSATEADELVDTAEYLGLSRSAVMAGHRRYLSALAETAWEDGVLTEDERADLQQVATLLGLGSSDLRAALSKADTARGSSQKRSTRATTFALTPGDPVVFTGTSDRTREQWNALALAAGLVPKPGVTKKTRVVVAADPDSQSAKARKAREYGIAIITEESFDRLLRAMT